jgi:hypothetical protein
VFPQCPKGQCPMTMNGATMCMACRRLEGEEDKAAAPAEEAVLPDADKQGGVGASSHETCLLLISQSARLPS